MRSLLTQFLAEFGGGTLELVIYHMHATAPSPQTAWIYNHLTCDAMKVIEHPIRDKKTSRYEPHFRETTSAAPRLGPVAGRDWLLGGLLG